MINAIMGNHRWLRREAGSSGVIELGAGDGSLARKLGKVTALDLAPAPEGLPASVRWVQGDLFETLPQAEGEVVLACLILHHFEADALAELGRLIEQSGVRRVLAAEPYRSRLALAEGYLLFPAVNSVTRHDMMVSIRAGFRRGELAPALGLDEGGWQVVESVTPFGALRFSATRR